MASETRSRLSEKMVRLWAVLGFVTLIALLAGFVVDSERAGLNLLLISYALVTLGLAGVVFAAIQYASGSAWSVIFRRVPENLVNLIPVGGVGLLAVFVLTPEIYEWSHEPVAGGGFKAFWLDWPFFLVRSGFYLAVWILLSRRILGHSRQQDVDRRPEHTRTNVRLSVVFLVVFGFTYWLASFDWIMSLEPEWFSTLFAIYHFSGLFLAGLAAITLIVLFLRRSRPFRDLISRNHLHDLGKLLFAFSTFWMYIWFSQYMLIWYADIPEETFYFVKRSEGIWLPLFVVVMLLNWAIPFAVLLPKKTKMDPSTLAQVCVVLLAGRWLDLYVMIFPAVRAEDPALGVLEACALVLIVAVVLLAAVHRLGDHALVPVHDPRLEESLHH